MGQASYFGARTSERYIDYNGYSSVGETYGELLRTSPSRHSLTHNTGSSAIHEIVSFCRPPSLTGLLMTIYSYPRSEDEEEKTKNVWLKGHTGGFEPWGIDLTYAIIRFWNGNNPL